jgi:UDP-glucose 4-epimerase
MTELCLVTGGAGFIGSHLVEALTADGARVRVLDDFSSGLRASLNGLSPPPEIIDGNLDDLDRLARAVEGCQSVFHLAAVASVQLSVQDPLATHRVCATGTVNLLDAARRAGVRRVVFAASASAYGAGAEVQKETDPLQALSPYAAAKLASEFYLQAFAASFKIETVRLRFFNVFGPRQRDDSPYSGVIAIFARALLEGRTPTIFGDGLQTRDFVYIRDVVAGLLKAARVPGISGKVYNIGTGRGTSVLDLLRELNRLLGTNVAPQFGSPRAGEVRHSRADISLARAELGFKPAVSLADGLDETVRWYRQR